MQQSVPPLKMLDPKTKDLLARLNRELDERDPAASATEKLGGVVKAGAELENLFEGLLIAVAERQGDLAPRVNGKSPEVAGAGELLRELRDRWRRRPNVPDALGTFLDAVCGWDSWFYRFVGDVRNPAAHTGEVNDEEARRLMRKMRKVVVSFRHQMDWKE